MRHAGVICFKVGLLRLLCPTCHARKVPCSMTVGKLLQVSLLQRGALSYNSALTPCAWRQQDFVQGQVLLDVLMRLAVS